MMQEAVRHEEEIIIKLDGTTNSIISKEKNTFGTQTSIFKHVSAETQTTVIIKEITGDTLIHKQVPKILIVANSLGRNLGKFISKLTMKYQYQSIIQPSAWDIEIIETYENTKKFTRNDIVIVWTSRLTKIINTNPILLPKLYH